jgi:hypothetical protein
MIVFLVTLARLLGSVLRGLRDPEFRALLFLVVILLLSGALFYRSVEGWTLLDSLYFSVATLTTVGYGDLSPTTPASKVFTMAYILVGVGVLLGFVSKVAANVIVGRQRLKERLKRP